MFDSLDVEMDVVNVPSVAWKCAPPGFHVPGASDSAEAVPDTPASLLTDVVALRISVGEPTPEPSWGEQFPVVGAVRVAK